MRWPDRKVHRDRTFLALVWLAVAFVFLLWTHPEIRWPRKTQQVGAMVSRAYVELRENKLHTAEESFRQILAIAPHDIEARLGLANALVLQNKIGEARRVLRSLVSADLNIEQRYRRSTMYGLAGDYSEAVRELALFERKITKTDWLKNGLAWAMSSQMWDLAVHLADRILENKSDGASWSYVVNQKAIALRALGQYQKAMALFEKVPAAENLKARAELASQLKHYERAIDLYREALRKRVIGSGLASLTARVRLAQLLNSQKRYTEAWTVLAALDAAGNLNVLRLKARTAFWSGNLKESATLFRSLRSKRADDRVVESDLALALERAGDSAEAERIYQQLIELDSHDRTTMVRFAWMLNTQHRYQEAWSLIQAAMDLNDQDTLDLRSRTAFWARRYEEAERDETSDAAGAKPPKIVDAPSVSGINTALAKVPAIKDTTSGSPILEKPSAPQPAQASHPRQPETIASLAYFAAARDQHLKSYRLFGKALDKGPEDPELFCTGVHVRLPGDSIILVRSQI